MEKETTVKKEAKQTFSKEQILVSKKYRAYRDILTSLLDDTKSYTNKEIDDRLKKFMSGRV